MFSTFLQRELILGSFAAFHSHLPTIVCFFEHLFSADRPRRIGSALTLLTLISIGEYRGGRQGCCAGRRTGVSVTITHLETFIIVAVASRYSSEGNWNSRSGSGIVQKGNGVWSGG
jgi:hypothetical protein